MIQLGSILAVMWLYRAKIAEVLIGLPTQPEARRFALMLFLAFVPAMLAGFFAADFVRFVLFESLLVIGAAFVIGGIVMLGDRALAATDRRDSRPTGRRSDAPSAWASFSASR